VWPVGHVGASHVACVVAVAVVVVDGTVTGVVAGSVHELLVSAGNEVKLGVTLGGTVH